MLDPHGSCWVQKPIRTEKQGQKMTVKSPHHPAPWHYTGPKEMATHSSTLAWKIHGQRSLVGYSPWGHKELDTTEWLYLISDRGRGDKRGWAVSGNDWLSLAWKRMLFTIKQKWGMQFQILHPLLCDCKLFNYGTLTMAHEKMPSLRAQLLFPSHAKRCFFQGVGKKGEGSVCFSKAGVIIPIHPIIGRINGHHESSCHQARINRY